MKLQNDPDWAAYREAVREHIVSTLNAGVRRNEMAGVLGVGRAAICSYVKGRTTPKPHIIEKLLRKWPTELPFRDKKFGRGAYTREGHGPIAAGIQGDLFGSLKAITPDDLKVEVKRVTRRGIRLSVEIKIAS
jgi:hypothetical protein